MGKYAEGRKTKPNIYSILRTGGEEHMYANMSSEEAAWLLEVCEPGLLWKMEALS